MSLPANDNTLVGGLTPPQMLELQAMSDEDLTQLWVIEFELIHDLLLTAREFDEAVATMEAVESLLETRELARLERAQSGRVLERLSLQGLAQ